MTKEEAEEYAKTMTHRDAVYNLTRAKCIPYRRATLIKVYELLDILDKIRDEIEKKIIKRPWLDFKDMERDRNDAFLEVLDIIDKYRKESEDK